MTLRVIGAGLGRTGTNSLRLALNRLGFGPCYHMHELVMNVPVSVPLWLAALNGHADWETIYKGYASAVDWPTAGFFRELNAVYPQAKFILTVRSAESWAESFSETIYKPRPGAIRRRQPLSPGSTWRTGSCSSRAFPSVSTSRVLANAFNSHTEAVKAAIPANRLLIFEVKDGWGPLCAFLGVPEPAEPFPRTNSRGDFWDAVAAAMASAG